MESWKPWADKSYGSKSRPIKERWKRMDKREEITERDVFGIRMDKRTNIKIENIINIQGKNIVKKSNNLLLILLERSLDESGILNMFYNV